MALNEITITIKDYLKLRDFRNALITDKSVNVYNGYNGETELIISRDDAVNELITFNNRLERKIKILKEKNKEYQKQLKSVKNNKKHWICKFFNLKTI